jgi:hypothetical protein
MNHSTKVGRNDLCPCGSGKKFKKCCMFNSNTTPGTPAASWMDNEGIHFVAPGTKPSKELLDKISQNFQDNFRNSPLWDEFVEQVGEDEAHKILKQCKAELR